MTKSPNKVEIRRLTVSFGTETALQDVSLDIPANAIFAVVGPAGSGKTTLLKSINRTIEFDRNVSVRGSITVDGRDIHRVRDVYDLRRSIGMVFPLPVGLPLSVYDNVAYAPRMAGIRGRKRLDEIVERCLRQAALWDEVKDRLKTLGTMLSGGQQQRLTIARALSLDPDILCLDEFSIAIDPVTTMKIEDVLTELKESKTIIMVTNLVQQARRLGELTCFMNKGRVVQVDATGVMFSGNPGNPMTRDYLSGSFG